MSTSVLDRVIKVIEQSVDLTPGTTLDASTTLVGAGLALDSITLLTILIGLETEFSLEISAEELVGSRGLQSVGCLAELVEAKLTAAG
jgi:acyl carrier protein